MWYKWSILTYTRAYNITPTRVYTAEHNILQSKLIYYIITSQFSDLVQLDNTITSCNY